MAAYPHFLLGESPLAIVGSQPNWVGFSQLHGRQSGFLRKWGVDGQLKLAAMKKTNNMADDQIKQYKTIGFWHSKEEPYFPDPAWFIDKNWDATERQIVIDYLKKGTALAHYRGYSWCRLKCRGNFGTADLTDGTYVYPEGLVHYIEAHDVRLPDDFIHHVKGIPSKSTSIIARMLTIFRKNKNIVKTNYGELDHNWWLSQKGFTFGSKPQLGLNK